MNEHEPRIESPLRELSIQSDLNSDLDHMSLDKPAALALLRTILISRHADLREQSLMRQGRGWFHVPAMGHEATAAAALHVRANDYCFPMYRDRAFVLSRGLTARDLARDFSRNGLVRAAVDNCQATLAIASAISGAIRRHRAPTCCPPVVLLGI